MFKTIVRKEPLENILSGSLISLVFRPIAPFAAAYVRFLKYDAR